jgi:glycosyltransferase involved in cell wall biosynthesis
MIADGLSDDGTREVLARFQALDMPYDLRVVDNPSGTIPDAWNTAVAEARGKYIIPLGSHSRLPGDYLESLVNALREPGRDVVGPTTRIIPGADTRLARRSPWHSILYLVRRYARKRKLARAYASRPCPWHCYSRELWEAIGLRREFADERGL